MQFHLRIQPSELDNLPFYEYEYMVEDLAEILEDKRKAESGQSSSDDMMNIKPDSLLKGMSKNMPNMGNFKFPSMNGFGLK